MRKKLLRVFLIVMTLMGVMSVTVTSFGTFCQVAVSSNPEADKTNNDLKGLGFAGPGLGFNRALQVETYEWQMNFKGECPPPPRGYVAEKALNPQGKELPGDVWKKKPTIQVISVGITILAVIALVMLDKKKSRPLTWST